MNTTYKMALFSYLAFIPMQALDVRPAFAQDKKAFMEFAFIDSYNKEKAALNSQAKNTAEILASTFLLYKLLQTLSTPSTEAPRKSYPEAFAATLLPEATPASALGTLLFGLLGYKAYATYQDYISKQAAFIVLANFLEEWDLNQEYTPECYQDFFNDLAEIYEIYGEDIVYDYAADIVAGLQFIIKRTELKVSEVYKKEFENNASGSTIFDTPKFLSEILKHSKEIIKL